MSTLSEHTGNGNSTETSLQLEDTKEQIYGVLQHFDVLPSSFDRFMFRSISVYLIGLLFGELLTISPIISQPQAERGLLALEVGALPMVIIISTTWLFNVWRLRTPKMLRDLFEKKRIYLPDGDADNSISAFLRTIVMPSQARK